MAVELQRYNKIEERSYKEAREGEEKGRQRERRQEVTNLVT